MKKSNGLRNKIIRKKKIRGYKCYLRRWYQNTDDGEITLYYTVICSDGYHRTDASQEDAERLFELLLDSINRMLVIDFKD